MEQVEKKVVVKTFEEKRGFKGSIKIGSNKLQVQCGCLDSWTKQMGKKKTSPVSVKVVQPTHALCKICGCIPWVVVSKKEAYNLLTSYTESKCDCRKEHTQHGAKCLACETKGVKL